MRETLSQLRLRAAAEVQGRLEQIVEAGWSDRRHLGVTSGTARRHPAPLCIPPAELVDARYRALSDPPIWSNSSEGSLKRPGTSSAAGGGCSRRAIRAKADPADDIGCIPHRLDFHAPSADADLPRGFSAHPRPEGVRQSLLDREGRWPSRSAMTTRCWCRRWPPRRVAVDNARLFESRTRESVDRKQPIGTADAGRWTRPWRSAHRRSVDVDGWGSRLGGNRRAAPACGVDGLVIVEVAGEISPAVKKQMTAVASAERRSGRSSRPYAPGFDRLDLAVDGPVEPGPALKLLRCVPPTLLPVCWCASRADEQPFSDKQLDMMAAFADQAALAWRLAAAQH